MPSTIAVLIPLYNDWNSAEILIKNLKKEIAATNDRQLQVLLVDDGSTINIPENFRTGLPTTVLHLTHNLGHQKAIAIGLSHIHHTKKFERVIVMDADGDDTPEAAAKLLDTSDQNPDKIIAAWRSERNENISKLFFYKIYLLIFYMLAGYKIRFGNFSVLPATAIKRLVYHGDIWLHFPAAIIKLKHPLIFIKTRKGRRYRDKSKMNLVSLVYHGICALAAFIDVIAIRLLLTSGFAISISIIALLSVIFIRLSTQLAIPGWASILGSSIVAILLISFLIALFLLFTFLILQSYRKFIPALHYKEFIDLERAL